jgi:uncharacterized membrane protein YqjE
VPINIIGSTSMINKEQEQFIQTTEKEVSLWILAGRTLPFIALAGLFLTHFIGWDTMYKQALTIGAILFFGVAVFWWWWAIYKMSAFAGLLKQTVENFKTINDELSKLKKDIHK